MLGITQSDTKYRECDKNVRIIDTVKKHLAGARLATLKTQNDVLHISRKVEIHAPNEWHSNIRSTLPNKSTYGLDTYMLPQSYWPNTRSSTIQVSTLPRWRERTRTRRVLNQPITQCWRHRTLQRQMGRPSPLCVEEVRTTSILRELLETKYDDHEGLVSTTSYRWMYRTFSIIPLLLRARLIQWLLANQ